MPQEKANQPSAQHEAAAVATGSGNELYPMSLAQLSESDLQWLFEDAARERSGTLQERYEKLQAFFTVDCYADEFCASLTAIERKYTHYVIAEAESDPNGNAAAIWAFREIIEQARIGFDLETYKTLFESPGTKHSATLSQIYKNYQDYLTGDDTYKGNRQTQSNVRILDAFIGLLGEIGN